MTIRYLVSFFLLVFSFVHLSQFQWLKHERSCAKAKASLVMKKQTSSLVSLCFHIAETKALIWEDDLELNYQEILYDVAYYSTEGDTITYFCYRDNEETNIIAKIKKILKDWRTDRDDNDTGANENLTLFFTIFQHQSSVAFYYLKDLFFTSYLFSYIIPEIFSTSPPPWYS